MRTLRTFAIRATYGLALAIGGAATLLPSAGLAASDLLGIVGAPTNTATFGSIDPATGNFTQIGGVASLPFGYYAPVFDTVQNAFFVTSQPVSGGGMSNRIDEIDAVTGAVSTIMVTKGGVPFGTISGLGYDSVAGQLFGIVGAPTNTATFGSIDPATGNFTQIGGVASLPFGYYAPVFDTVQNAFFVTSQPVSGGGMSNRIDEIDAVTGAVSTIMVTKGGVPFGTISGLGYDSVAGQLFGIVGAPTNTATFGSIDPATGNFTQIGGVASLPFGYYAPVFDTVQNAFFVTSQPVSGGGMSNRIDEIDAVTGAVSTIMVTKGGVPFGTISGLGVASSPTAAVPEPSTWTMMLVGLAGLGYGAFRRSRRPRLDGVAA